MAGMNYFDSNRRNTVILKFEAVNGDALVVVIPSISYAAAEFYEW
jgi:hypothetical protein